mmetsp:Transcript_17239/g.65775  ORF Transcript_17239/g.65775 Transcript_17239/m.65775 type:complete len:131 (-) Transcript_17239:354-746(-)
MSRKRNQEVESPDGKKKKARASRPDYGARRLRQQDSTMTAIKCGLAKLGLCRKLADAIELVVPRIQRMTFRASRVANYCVRRLLDQGEQMPMLDHTFFNRCLSVTGSSGCRSRFPPILAAYEELYGDRLQ